ncbi:multicopper oxidase domain-containing protein [Marine Group I thaumarchaeote]|uniref:Copper-containing nitrite reductase n=1 Tax=Marine Group I thaumarchaeote TaxID=2511932 RepID=A0A7K4P4X4_9ARCH|nr:multicopper oxidase domain-containing protein [Marine Group I thaumarchaeote]
MIALIIGLSMIVVFSTLSEVELEQKTLVTSSGALIRTTGEIINPIDYSGEPLDFDPDSFLRDFNYGKVSQLSDGTTLREFTLIAEDDKIMEISPGIFFNVWTYNGATPGPTIRVTEGDLIRVKFINNGEKSHTVHFHGTHPAEMDGVFENVGPGGKFTYEFVAGPAGVHLYHCHVAPVEEHVSRGLYGAFIIDPKEGREPADEMVMILNGFDTDFDTENNFYAVNTIPFYHLYKPIEIDLHKLVRLYVINILEFDPINNFHLHGNMFNYYPIGTQSEPSSFTDIVTFSQGDRGIIEFEYKYPGKYLFHAHKVEFSEKGWVGIFLVKDNQEKNIQEIKYGT